MTKSFQIVVELDKRSEICKSGNLAVNDVARLMCRNKLVPGVWFKVLYRQREPAVFGIDAGDNRINLLPLLENFAGVLDAFRPAHLRHVDQTFDAWLQFDKRPVIRNTRNLAVQSSADWESLFNRRPGIRQKLLVSERNSLAFLVKLEHLNLNCIANPEQFSRILKPTPRHISHVEQTINAAEVDKRAIIGEVLYLSLDNDV